MRSRSTQNCTLSKHERFAVEEVQMGTKMLVKMLVIQNSVWFDKKTSEKYVNKAHGVIFLSFISSCFHSFIHSFTHSLIHSYNNSIIYFFIRSFTSYIH